MAVSYEKLFEKMHEKGLTTYKIKKEGIIAEPTLQKLRTGKVVTTKTIERLCIALDCQPSDIMTVTRDKGE